MVLNVNKADDIMKLVETDKN